MPSNGLTAEAVRALHACRHLRGLRVLDLSNNRLDDDGARVLSLCPHVDRLTQLDLGLNRIHRSGASRWPNPPSWSASATCTCWATRAVPDPATVSGLRFRFADRVIITERRVPQLYVSVRPPAGADGRNHLRPLTGATATADTTRPGIAESAARLLDPPAG